MTETVKDNTKVKTMLTQMGRDVEELRSSEAWTAMLKVQARFHRYSASNQLMIYMQNPDATRVAGFRQWQALGRQVQKGERGLKIFAPMTRKDKTDDSTKLIGFKLVSVFDISQTEGDDLPIVEWPAATDCPDGLLDRLRLHIESQLGLTVLTDVDQHPLQPTARGWYDIGTSTINLRPASEASVCSTLLHEAGHALDPKLEVDTDRQRRELVAESVSFVLGLPLGISLTEEVTHYLASWKGGVDELLAVVDRVKSAVAAFGEIKVLVSA